MDAGIVILISLLYLILLFGIAIYGNKMSKAGQSIVNNPLVYSLSLAVYCTVWTYYGSVGRAAETGLGFVAVYLGPTIMAPILVHGHAQDDFNFQTIKGHIYS
jgi:Na+/proline symporter